MYKLIIEVNGCPCFEESEAESYNGKEYKSMSELENDAEVVLDIMNNEFCGAHEYGLEGNIIKEL